MAYCKYCGQPIDSDAAFCSSCGNPISIKKNTYILPRNERRLYEISVENGVFSIEGDFLYLDNMDFYSSNGCVDGAPVSDYIGIGFLSKRSYRKVLIFFIAGTIFTFFKNVLDYLDKFGVSLRPVTVIYYILMGICIYNLVKILLDKKKVIEISFIGKRFAIPQSSINDEELHVLKLALENKK
ncbi:MAG: zinc ribbon domain-containing protein [Lachnospiraceae bacterium]|nr:zinc ribbon domain-containing protein [Lachnospiraceae bacterium]